MATDTKKRERMFDRSYDDKAGKSTIANSKSGDTVAELSIADAHANVSVGGALRYLTDGWVSTYTNALKAEGGTHEKALAAADAYWELVKSGEYAFRAGAGEGGLTVEQEHDVLVAAMVASVGVTEEEARAKVNELYAITRIRKQKVKTKTKDAQGVETETETERDVTDRPDYNKLKRIPQMREALAKAEGDEGAKTLKGLFEPKAA